MTADIKTVLTGDQVDDFVDKLRDAWQSIDHNIDVAEVVRAIERAVLATIDSERKHGIVVIGGVFAAPALETAAHYVTNGMKSSILAEQLRRIAKAIDPVTFADIAASKSSEGAKT